MLVLLHACSIRRNKNHMVFYSWSVMKLHTHESENVPCVAVKTHNDALDASPIFRASAFCEQFINLFLSGVKTQVTDLINILSKLRDIACKNAHRESRTWKAGRPASVYRREIGSPCNLKAGRGAARRAPLEKGLLLPTLLILFWKATRHRVSSSTPWKKLASRYSTHNFGCNSHLTLATIGEYIRSRSERENRSLPGAPGRRPLHQVQETCTSSRDA